MDFVQLKDWIESGKTAYITKALQNLQAYLIQQGDIKDSKERVKTITQHIHIHSFLPCFDTKSLIQLQLIVSVFGKILDEINIDQALKEDPVVQQFLIQGYKHPFEIVRRLTITQLLRCSVATLFERPDVYGDVLYQAMIDPEISVQKVALQIIQKICSTKEGVDLLFVQHKKFLIDPLLETLSQTGNETIRFRVYELMAAISSQSEDAFQAVVNTRVYNLFSEDFSKSKDDVLSLVNFLEIFKSFCIDSYNKKGVEILRQIGGFELLMKILIDNQNDPLAYSFILNLIADLSDSSEELFFGEENALSLPTSVIEKIFNEELSSTSNKEAQIVAISVIGALCKTSAKNLQSILLNDSDRCTQFLSFYGDSINDMIWQSFCHSLGSILESRRVSDALAEQLIGALEKILKKRSEPPITQPSNSYIMNYAMYNLKDPFPDVRCAVYHLFKGMATRINIVKEHMNVYPGFFDFLTNRTTEPNKETKEWKYNLIEVLHDTLHKNHTVAGVDAKHMIDLKTYILRGAYVGDKGTPQAIIASEYSE